MKSKSVLFEGGVEKISTLADGSLRVHIGTPELSDETMVNLFKMNRFRTVPQIFTDRDVYVGGYQDLKKKLI